MIIDLLCGCKRNKGKGEAVLKEGNDGTCTGKLLQKQDI